MALTALTLLTGATITPTGGTTQTFAPSGTDIVSGLEVVDVAATDYRTRPRVVVRTKMPTLASDGTYSKMKFSATYLKPMVDSNGKTQFNLVRVEIEKHPEISVADAAELLNKGAQLCVDADFASFWSTGSRG